MSCSVDCLAIFAKLDRQVKELDLKDPSLASRRCGQPASAKRFLELGRSRRDALVASVSDARTFKNGRQFAAWLRLLVPRQKSSGGKERLLGISKRGDTYLRTLLIHGARAVVRHLKPSAGEPQGWLARVAESTQPQHCGGSYWPTRTLALFGQCWHMIEITKPGMSAHASRGLERNDS